MPLSIHFGKGFLFVLVVGKITTIQDNSNTYIYIYIKKVSYRYI